MINRIIITLFLLGAGVQLTAQETESKVFEKFRMGFGAETMTYLDYPVQTFAYKVEVQTPIYERLSLNLSFADHSSYFDYCDEIPVSVTEKHFVYGLNYTFFNKKRWSFGAMVALDTEFTDYKEQDHIPSDAAILHREGAHQESHSYREHYTEGLLGVEANYQISKNFMLNFSSRLNTYASFRNSMSLFYTFDLGRTNNCDEAF